MIATVMRFRDRQGELVEEDPIGHCRKQRSSLNVFRAIWVCVFLCYTAISQSQPCPDPKLHGKQPSTFVISEYAYARCLCPPLSRAPR
jgi:hypothetical protein